MAIRPKKKSAKPVRKASKSVKKRPLKKGVRPVQRTGAVKKVLRKAASASRAKAASAKALSADELLKKGKERGYITYSEILRAFPHVEDDVDFLEGLYERFSVAGVDVLECGILEDNADQYLATRNIKDRQSTGYDSIQIYL